MSYLSFFSKTVALLTISSPMPFSRYFGMVPTQPGPPILRLSCVPKSLSMQNATTSSLSKAQKTLLHSPKYCTQSSSTSFTAFLSLLISPLYSPKVMFSGQCGITSRGESLRRSIISSENTQSFGIPHMPGSSKKSGCKLLNIFR